MPKLSQRLLFAVVGCVALGSACGGDETVPLEPVTYELSIRNINGGGTDEVQLRCDGTLSVAVGISPPNTFSLRPAFACGTSPRCGYVHFEALAANGDVLASADSATLEGVLRVGDAEPSELRVSLRSGVDQETIVNADGTDVELSVTPESFIAPEGCDDVGAGGAGGGGAGGAGAGGAPQEPSAGGAGGEATDPAGGAAGAPLGGAGGDAPSAGAGGG